MEAEPSFSMKRNQPSAKPYFKLRLGGSRSTVVTGKFLKDTLPTSKRLLPPSLEPTRSLDSQSISSRSTDSSLNQEKVRIMGRGGAGARRRNYTKVVPVSAYEMRPLHAPESVQEPVVRNVGRGGLGSRPQVTFTKGKKVELSHKRSKSKQLKPSPSLELRPRSQVSTISTIHFAGETGLPPPDFFKVTKRSFQKSSVLDNTSDQMDEDRDFNRASSASPRPPSRNSLSAVPWDDTPTASQSDLARAKAKRRERGFSLLLSVFQHDVTRRPDSGLTPPSMSIPSQITLTSIDTDPSCFFHGSGSRPSTPPCSQETDSTTASSYSARLGSSLSSFQREPSPPSMPSSEEIDDSRHEEPHESSSSLSSLPSSRQPEQQHEKHHDTTKSREDVSLAVPQIQILGMHLSPSEAEALGTPPCSPFLQENIPFEEHHYHHYYSPAMTMIPETEAGSKAKSEESESWTGEWNVGMVEVIRALRELR